jgi:hypothetical protein
MAGDFSLCLKVVFFELFDLKFFLCKFVKICFEKAGLDPGHGLDKSGPLILIVICNHKNARIQLYGILTYCHC